MICEYVFWVADEAPSGTMKQRIVVSVYWFWTGIALRPTSERHDYIVDPTTQTFHTNPPMNAANRLYTILYTAVKANSC